MQNKWFRVPKDEQETIIHFDYEEEVINIYTCRSVTAGRLEKILGSGKHGMFKGKICSEEWYIPFEDIATLKKLFRYKIFVPKKQNKIEKGEK